MTTSFDAQLVEKLLGGKNPTIGHVSILLLGVHLLTLRKQLEDDGSTEDAKFIDSLIVQCDNYLGEK